MKPPLKSTVFAVSSSFLALGAGALIYSHTLPTAIPYSASSQQPTQAPKTHSFYRGHIESVSSTGVTITRTIDKTQNTQVLPLNQITVRAGWTTLSSHMLVPGEVVSVNETHGSSWVLSLHPVAQGKLRLNNGSWMIHKRVIGGSPVMEGASQMTAGVPVAVYGTRNGNQIAALVVQVRPKMVAGTVTQNASGRMTVNTKKAGQLQYTYSGALNSAQLGKIPVGHKVLVGTNPLTHQVLFARAIRHTHWGKIAKTLTHNVYGQLTQSSSTSLTIQGKWGSQQVHLNIRRVKVIWNKHPHTSASQVPAGSLVMLHEFHNRWILHVMPTHQ